MAIAARCTCGDCCSPGMTTLLPALAFRSAATAERNLPAGPEGGCALDPPAPTAAANADAKEATSPALRDRRCSALKLVVLGALSTAYSRFIGELWSSSLRRLAQSGARRRNPGWVMPERKSASRETMTSASCNRY